MLFFPTTNALAHPSVRPPGGSAAIAPTRELSRAEWLAFLLVDQHQRWERGDCVPVESYRHTHPRLKADDEAFLDLIYSELVLREAHGDQSSLDEYLDRFPQYEEPLRQQFALHAETEETDTPPVTCRMPGGAWHEHIPLDEGDDTEPGPWDFDRKETLDALTHRARPNERLPTAWPVVPGYEILGELGRGGMGVVYKARQKDLKRLVALKMIQADPLVSPDESARFRLEAEAVARLQHPNIVQIFEVGTWQAGGTGPPRPFIALELIDGGSLDDRIDGKPQSPRAAAELLEPLARAMHYAHQRGIVHRDLKPANILLQAHEVHGSQSVGLGFGTAKITDFGLAKRLDDSSTVTRNGAVLGTPSYMAPEQAAGSPRHVGPACDVYSLGAILYEMLTGRPPFQGETAWDTLLHLAIEEPVPPRRLQPRMPLDLETICLKCLEKDAARRYASAGSLADDLRRFLEGRPILARRTSLRERAGKWARRRPAAAALVFMSGMTGLLLLAGGLLYGHAKHQEARLLEQELTGHRRWDAARTAAQDWIRESQKAASARDWQSARLHLCRALAHVAAEPSLADIQTQAERLLSEVNARFDEQQRRQEARQRYDRFQQQRDEALFQATRFLGWDQATDWQTVRNAARQALELYGLTSGHAPLTLDGTFLEPREQTTLRDGCYELLLVLAEAVTAPGDRAGLEQALRHLDRADRLGITTRVNPMRRARYLEQLGDAAGAAQARRRAETRIADHAIDFFLAGQEAVQAGDPRRAISELERALRLEPDHFWSWYFLAVSYLQAGQLTEAKTCLTTCLSRRPHYVWLYVLRGHAQAELHDFASADDDFRLALELQPDDLARYGVWVNRGAARFRQGRLAEAESDLRKALQLKPDEYPAYLNLAQVYQAGQQSGKAGELLDQAVQKHPDSPLLYRARSRWHQQQRRDEAALTDLDTAIRLESPAAGRSRTLAVSYQDKGRVLHRLGRHDEAVSSYETALELDPDQTAVHRLRGEALLEMGRFTEALQALDAYLKHGSAEAAVYRTRGLIRSQLGKHAQALEDYTRALELQPEAATHVCRGWAYLLVHDAPRLALRDFEDAIRLDPQNGDAYNGRGCSRVVQGQVRAGLADVEEALRRGPPSSRLLYNAARSYVLASSQPGPEGRLAYPQRALQLLKQSLEAQPATRRSLFWRDLVQTDSTWNALRRSPGYVLLAAEYAK